MSSSTKKSQIPTSTTQNDSSQSQLNSQLADLDKVIVSAKIKDKRSPLNTHLQNEAILKRQALVNDAVAKGVIPAPKKQFQAPALEKVESIPVRVWKNMWELKYGPLRYTLALGIVIYVACEVWTQGTISQNLTLWQHQRTAQIYEIFEDRDAFREFLATGKAPYDKPKGMDKEERITEEESRNVKEYFEDFVAQRAYARGFLPADEEEDEEV